MGLGQPVVALPGVFVPDQSGLASNLVRRSLEGSAWSAVFCGQRLSAPPAHPRLLALRLTLLRYTAGIRGERLGQRALRSALTAVPSALTAVPDSAFGAEPMG